MDETQLRPNPDVVWRQVGDEVVLVNMKTNRIYSLNSTGARLWELLDSGADRREIEQAMLDEFDVEPAQLREEIDSQLDRLAREGLVT
jgi:Coenzyme PQQ synthesis protein D (PqqD)